MLTRSGMTRMPARIFGVTRYLSGSMVITSRARICSEIRMMPSSAVMAEPALAPTIRAPSTGPSSRTSPMETVEPRSDSEPNPLRA